MGKILFVTNRNILTTSGELRLIKNRAEALYTEYGVVSDFVVLQKRDRIVSEKREAIEAGGELVAFELSIKKPYKSVKHYFDMKKYVLKTLMHGGYDAVILSGPGMVNLAKRVKKNLKVRVIIDIHGSSEDILALTSKKGLLSKMKSKVVYFIDSKSLKKNLCYADGCFVVTRDLEAYVKSNFNPTTECQYYVAPCATSVTTVDLDMYRINRENYRKKYNVDDEVVFIYSGGVSSWQCIEETLQLFRKIRDSAKFKCRLLMFSHNTEFIREMVGDDESVTVDSYSPDELAKALTAGDYAFLLRTDCITNNVAFPNKYLEYVLSGMKIIATPYIYEVARQIARHEIGFLYNMNGEIGELFSYLSRSYKSESNWKEREKVLFENSFKERLSSFVKELS